MRRAALAGEPFLEDTAAPTAPAAEKTLSVARALVESLEAEHAATVQALNAASHEVAKIVDKLMRAEAESVAAALWQIRQDEAALRARLEAFAIATPPSAEPRAPRAEGALFRPATLTVARFPTTPTIDRALYGALGTTRPPGTPDPTALALRAWTEWASALVNDPAAALAPLPNEQEQL